MYSVIYFVVCTLYMRSYIMHKGERRSTAMFRHQGQRVRDHKQRIVGVGHTVVRGAAPAPLQCFPTATPRFLGCESEAACPVILSPTNKESCAWVLQRSGGQPPSRCDGPHQPHEDSLVDVGWSMAPPPRRRSHRGPRVRDQESETVSPKPQVRDRESDRVLRNTADHDAGRDWC